MPLLSAAQRRSKLFEETRIVHSYDMDRDILHCTWKCTGRRIRAHEHTCMHQKQNLNAQRASPASTYSDLAGTLQGISLRRLLRPATHTSCFHAPFWFAWLGRDSESRFLAVSRQRSRSEDATQPRVVSCHQAVGTSRVSWFREYQHLTPSPGESRCKTMAEFVDDGQRVTFVTTSEFFSFRPLCNQCALALTCSVPRPDLRCIDQSCEEEHAYRHGNTTTRHVR